MNRFAKWFFILILLGYPNECSCSIIPLRGSGAPNTAVVVPIKQFTLQEVVPIRSDAVVSGDIQVNDIWQLIGGSYYPADSSKATTIKLELGYVPLKELAALARTSAALNILFQPILSIAKAWRQSEVIHRALRNQSDSIDYLMASLFTGHLVIKGISSLGEAEKVGLPASSFNLALYALCNSLINISDEERAAIRRNLGKFPFDRAQNNLIHRLYNGIIDLHTN